MLPADVSTGGDHDAPGAGGHTAGWGLGLCAASRHRDTAADVETTGQVVF